MLTKTTKEDSVREYKRRHSLHPYKYHQEYQSYLGVINWVRVQHRIILPPNSLTFAEAEPDSRMSEPHSFLSLFDGMRMMSMEGDLYVPSLSFEEGRSTVSSQAVYKLPFANSSESEITLWPGFIVGEMVDHATDATHHSIDCYPLKELLEEIERRESVTGDEFVCTYGITSAHDVCNINNDCK